MKRTYILAIAACLTLCCAMGVMAKKDKKTAPAPMQEPPFELKTSQDSLSFAAGMANTEGLEQFLQQKYGVTKAQMEGFKKGFKQGLLSKDDSMQKAFNAGLEIAEMVSERMLPGVKKSFSLGNDTISEEVYYKGFLQALDGDTTVWKVSDAADYFIQKSKEQMELQKQQNKAMGERFLEENAKREGVVTTASGLQYKVLVKGLGATPKAEDEVVVKYEGKTVDGHVFDSSYKRNPDSSTFRCNEVIKGWTEALTMMTEGSTWELYIPYQLAYGERGAGKDIRPMSALIFKVELLSIKAGEAKAEETAKAAATSAKKAATAQKKPATAKKRRRL